MTFDPLKGTVGQKGFGRSVGDAPLEMWESHVRELGTRTVVPAPRPCGSCPYRRDVPSGIWDEEEYLKLPEFDGETFAQPPAAFFCHQQDGRLCAGWVAVHDMEESLGLRLLSAVAPLDEAQVDAICDYATDVPLFESGAEAAEHGLRDVPDPSPRARKMIGALLKRRAR